VAVNKLSHIDNRDQMMFVQLATLTAVAGGVFLDEILRNDRQGAKVWQSCQLKYRRLTQCAKQHSASVRCKNNITKHQLCILIDISNDAYVRYDKLKDLQMYHWNHYKRRRK